MKKTEPTHEKSSTNEISSKDIKSIFMKGRPEVLWNINGFKSEISDDSIFVTDHLYQNDADISNLFKEFIQRIHLFFNYCTDEEDKIKLVELIEKLKPFIDKRNLLLLSKTNTLKTTLKHTDPSNHASAIASYQQEMQALAFKLLPIKRLCLIILPIVKKYSPPLPQGECEILEALNEHKKHHPASGTFNVTLSTHDMRISDAFRRYEDKRLHLLQNLSRVLAICSAPLSLSISAHSSFQDTSPPHYYPALWKVSNTLLKLNTIVEEHIDKSFISHHIHLPIVRDWWFSLQAILMSPPMLKSLYYHFEDLFNEPNQEVQSSADLSEQYFHHLQFNTAKVVAGAKEWYTTLRANSRLDLTDQNRNHFKLFPSELALSAQKAVLELQEAVKATFMSQPRENISYEKLTPGLKYVDSTLWDTYLSFLPDTEKCELNAHERISLREYIKANHCPPQASIQFFPNAFKAQNSNPVTVTRAFASNIPNAPKARALTLAYTMLELASYMPKPHFPQILFLRLDGIQHAYNEYKSQQSFFPTFSTWLATEAKLLPVEYQEFVKHTLSTLNPQENTARKRWKTAYNKVKLLFKPSYFCNWLLKQPHIQQYLTTLSCALPSIFSNSNPRDILYTLVELLQIANPDLDHPVNVDARSHVFLPAGPHTYHNVEEYNAHRIASDSNRRRKKGGIYIISPPRHPNMHIVVLEAVCPTSRVNLPLDALQQFSTHGFTTHFCIETISSIEDSHTYSQAVSIQEQPSSEENDKYLQDLLSEEKVLSELKNLELHRDVLAQYLRKLEIKLIALSAKFKTTNTAQFSITVSSEVYSFLLQLSEILFHQPRISSSFPVICNLAYIASCLNMESFIDSKLFKDHIIATLMPHIPKINHQKPYREEATKISRFKAITEALHRLECRDSLDMKQADKIENTWRKAYMTMYKDEETSASVSFEYFDALREHMTYLLKAYYDTHTDTYYSMNFTRIIRETIAIHLLLELNNRLRLISIVHPQRCVAAVEHRYNHICYIVQINLESDTPLRSALLILEQISITIPEYVIKAPLRHIELCSRDSSPKRLNLQLPQKFVETFQELNDIITAACDNLVRLKRQDLLCLIDRSHSLFSRKENIPTARLKK